MTIWAALLLAPLLVVANLSLHTKAAPACELTWPGALVGVAFVCLVVVAALTGLAWREMRRAEGNAATNDRHFLALVATESGALSWLLIVALWLPWWLASGC